MKALNKTQQKILDYLKECASEGVPPTVREIGEAVGLKSTSSVHTNLVALEEMGYIRRNDGLNRAIHLTQSEKVTQVPLLGRVTAGMPALAVEEIEGYIPFSAQHKQDKELFALRIDGESMINCGILNGDVIICERTASVDNGEIVVALLYDEATCKRFYKENGQFRLQPENDFMDPIIVDEVAILGKVIASIRYYH